MFDTDEKHTLLRRKAIKMAQSRIIEGRVLIDPSLQKDWENFVLDDAASKYDAGIMSENVLQVLRGLYAGVNNDELYRIIAKQNHTYPSYRLLFTLLDYFGGEKGKNLDAKLGINVRRTGR